MRKARNLSGGKLTETKPSKNMMGMYGALLLKQGRDRVPVYDGSVPNKVIEKRRAKNQVAKRTRKTNRGK